MSVPFRLSLTPLAVAVIIVATAAPMELRGEMGWNLEYELVDLLQNVVLYVPLGIALWQRPLKQVVLVAGILSLLCEATQLRSVGRFASPYDVLSNTGGAVLAALLFKMLRRRRPANAVTIPVTRSSVLAAVLVLALIFTAWARESDRTQLSSWDSSYPLLVGNEQGAHRPWHGTITAVRMFGTALSRGQIVAVESGADGGVRPEYQSLDTLVLSGGPAVVLPADLSQRFARVASAGNQFSILLTVRTEYEAQEGPARLLSFSSDSMHRNFDLGQHGRRFAFRIRTPVTGTNGGNLRTSTRPLVRAGKEVRLAATYDGSVARLYVDGSLDSRRDLDAAACDGRMLCDRTTPSVWALAGSLLAIMMLAFLPARSRRSVWTVSLVAAAIAISAGMTLPVSPRIPASQVLLPLAAFVGATCIAWARMSALESLQA